MRNLTVIVPLVLLGACAGDPDLGAAINHNTVAQAVDMNPQYAGTSMEGSNGQRSADAYKRYLKGTVKELVKVDGGTRVGGQGGAGDSATAPQ